MGATFTFNGAPLTLIGGVDASYPATETDDAVAVACLAVLSFPSLETVRLDFEPFAPAAEYVPGRLADREHPPYLALLRRCPRPLAPQCVFVDGNGVLHPERFGIACRLGVDAATPTIGVAKNLLRVDGVDARARSKRDRDASDVGEVELVDDSGTVVGVALSGHDVAGVVTKPVYVSAGAGMDLATATALTRACSRHRVPEPIRAADVASRAWLRERQGAS
jgi:deoxyinosine 3'endonuclease (endonuclease V)